MENPGKPFAASEGPVHQSQALVSCLADPDIPLDEPILKAQARYGAAFGLWARHRPRCNTLGVGQCAENCCTKYTALHQLLPLWTKTIMCSIRNFKEPRTVLGDLPR